MMNAALIEAMGRTEVKARFSLFGAEAIESTPEAFASSWVARSAKWEQLIRDKNIQLD